MKVNNSIIDFQSRKREIQRNRLVKEPLDLTKTIALLNRGRIDEAIHQFNDLVECYPNDASVWYNLGYALSERGLSQKSVDAYKETLKIDSYYHNARFNLALELIALNLIKEAEGELKILSQLCPHDADVCFELGRLYEGQTLNDFALFQYEKVIKLRPNFRLIYFCKANILFRTKRYEEALKSYRQELDRNPDFSEAHQMLKMVQEAIEKKTKKT